MKKQGLKPELKKYKYKYLFLLTIVFIGLISGIIFANILSYNDHKEVGEVVSNYFLNLQKGVPINYLGNLINSFGVNMVYLLLIFILALSIIGIILNPFILYLKSVITGFSVGIIISIYGLRGLMLAIFYIFPHQILNLLVYVLLTFYGINLSLKLFNSLFLKKTFNYSLFMKKYFKVILIATALLLISSLYETFLNDFIMKLFTFLLK